MIKVFSKVHPIFLKDAAVIQEDFMVISAALQAIKNPFYPHREQSDDPMCRYRGLVSCLGENAHPPW